MSKCLRAIVEQTCVTLMASFGVISGTSPPPYAAAGLVALALVAGISNGSLHDACKEV